MTIYRLPQSKFGDLTRLSRLTAEAMVRRRLDREIYSSQYLLNLISRYPYMTKKDQLPPAFSIVCLRWRNLCQFRPYWVEMVTTIETRRGLVKETEKSYIINDGRHRRIISKAKILCFVW